MEKPSVIILGIAQDAGYPHAGCKKDCCKEAWGNKTLQRSAACIGIADPKSESYWLIDATPDIKFQMNMAEEKFNGCKLKGVFLTHAHTGHYTGLIHFGKEMMSTKMLPVYVLPKMKNFLSNNLPWKLLENSGNIELRELKFDDEIVLNERIAVQPFEVQHRDEFSETAGYQIKLLNKKIIYIPDIDSWELWDKDIKDIIKYSDWLFLDGTFFTKEEIKYYESKNIPHPLVSDSIKKFEEHSLIDKNKIHFIHLNHTNPLIRVDSEESKYVISKGFKIAFEGQIIEG
ncbi:MAG: MBL fold metallo-hydrolase [Ignavibacteria bacterium]